MDDEDDAPRALLIQGIPLGCRGRDVTQAITEYCQIHGLRRPQVKYTMSIHRRLLNGCATMIFGLPEAATAVLQAVSEYPLMVMSAAVKVSRGAGRLRDHFFGSLTFAERRGMQLDACAATSITDSFTAGRMTTLLAAIYACFKPSRTHFRVLDATACVGGNTIGIMVWARGTPGLTVAVDAVELNEGRCDMLQHNVAAIHSPATVRVMNGDCVDVVTEPDASWNLIMLDPPWGGPQHKQSSAGCIALDSLDGERRSKAQSALCLTILECFWPRCEILALKLPRSEEGDAVVAEFVQAAVGCCPESGVIDERPFPFLFNFGGSIQLLAMISNGPLTMQNKTLDHVVSNICRWHSFEGCSEHKPRFFDFEKRRWIELKKWLPEAARTKSEQDCV